MFVYLPSILVLLLGTSQTVYTFTIFVHRFQFSRRFSEYHKCKFFVQNNVDVLMEANGSFDVKSALFNPFHYSIIQFHQLFNPSVENVFTVNTIVIITSNNNIPIGTGKTVITNFDKTLQNLLVFS